MPKENNDLLFNLIKRMSKAEKRRFKLSVGSKIEGKEKLFVRVFDVLEAAKSFDESQLLKKIPKLKKSQLSNIKAHLLKHIMSNLRHLYRPHKLDIEIRDLQDNARVFYAKGMYKAALQSLEKAKRIAKEYEMNTAFFNCVEFEKKIESQHITGSMYPKAEKLTLEIEESLRQVTLNNQLSNLSLRLYGNYLKYGHVKDQEGASILKQSFMDQLPKVEFDSLDFYGKLYFLQSHVWFSYSVLDFANYFRYAHRWVQHYQDNPVMIEKETSMYLKGFHNLLNAYFTHNKFDKFLTTYKQFLEFKLIYGPKVDQNSLQLIENLEWIHGLNVFFLNSNYTAGAEYLDKLIKSNIDSIRNWNLHRALTIYYKIACIYFVAERYDDAIEYLNIISNKVYPAFRQDIQSFARILNLIVHFDLGNLFLLKYQVKSVYRFLLKLEEMQGVQQEIFNFLKKLPSMNEAQLLPAFKNLEIRLIKLQTSKYEKRAFLYLDIISWLQSKIENLPLQEVMQRKQILAE